ncbi:Anthocyanidin 3-O-glucosyltransferase UFGT [Euphorbia peplus]|nr:Anthocyanidin 3-O-glucosyltransferase UFGT [Euphorbia peplus]
MESVMGGVPMICRPIWADNHMTAEMVEEVWEIGVRIEGGKFTMEGLLKCLETIFHNEKAKKFREKVNNLKQVLLKKAGPDGVARQDFNSLVKLIAR